MDQSWKMVQRHSPQSGVCLQQDSGGKSIIFLTQEKLWAATVMFMHTWCPQELHSCAWTGSQVTLAGVGRGHKKWLWEGDRSSPRCWLGQPWRRKARNMPSMTSWSLWPCHLLQGPSGDCKRFLFALTVLRVLRGWCFSVQWATSIFPPMAADLSAA